MAIRNVNGRNVYVLEPRQPTGKTTSGRNWATLYSDLRWQVWEEIQKNEAAMLKMELSSAKMRKEYYDDKIKVLQDQRKQLQAAALKAKKGQVGSANSDALRAAEGLERIKRQTKGKTVTTERPLKTVTGKIRKDPDTKQPLTETIVRTEEPFGGVSQKASEVYKKIVDKFLAGEATEAEVKEAAAAAGVSPTAGEPIAKPAGPSIDQQIEALDRDLEQLLLQRQAATSGLDANLLRRTREGFAEQVGVIGQGGGPFGLAPRRRRTMPFVQQELAQERIDQFTRDREEAINRAAFQARQQKAEIGRLRGLAAELEAIGLGGEGGEADMLLREADELERTLLTPEQAALSADEAIRQRYLELEEFTPRRPGELLLRDRPRRPAGEFEPPRMAGQEEVSSPAAMRRAEERLEAIDRGLEPLQEPVPPISEMGPAAPSPAPAPVTLPADEEIVFAPGQVFAPGEVTDEEIVFAPSEVTVEPQIREGQANLGGGYVFDGQSGIIFGPTGYPVFSTYKQEVPEGVEAPQVVSEVALRGIAQRIRETGGDISSVEGYQTKEARPEDFELDEEIETPQPAGPPQTSTKQRKDKYKFDVVSEGTKLARTPKKLQRLAKTNLPEENRPEHYVIVDKLYDVNRGKAEAFKMTYDEISRAFQNDPQKRSEAHSYLVAKDILETDVSEPLA